MRMNSGLTTAPLPRPRRCLPIASPPRAASTRRYCPHRRADADSSRPISSLIGESEQSSASRWRSACLYLRAVSSAARRPTDVAFRFHEIVQASLSPQASVVTAALDREQRRLSSRRLQA